MSSRAASSRKRLNPGENSRPSPSKSFFSRSKASPIPQISTRIISPPDTSKGPTLIPDIHSQTYDSYQPNPYADSDVTLITERPRDRSFTHTSSLPPPSKRANASQLTSRSPYPSPHDSDSSDDHTRHVNHLNARSQRGYMTNDYGSGVGFIEASYQPPPPIQASYQPPPPSLSTRANGHHENTEIFSKPTTPSSANSLSAFPPPSGYPTRMPSRENMRTGIPSPLSSPAQSSLLLQRSSPTPTELPTYSSVHEVPYSTFAGAEQPIFDMPPPNPTVSRRQRHEYYQNDHHNSYPYSSPVPAPAPHRPSRHTPSPLNIPGTPPSHSATSLPDEHDFRRPWARGVGSGGSSPSSPILTNVRRSERPPESISGSSGSSSSKHPSINTPTPGAAPAFVFPGSRSIAKPKVSSKTGTPKVKLKSKNKDKTIAASNSDTSLASPPTTPAVEHSAYDPPRSAGSSDTTRFQVTTSAHRAYATQRHPDSYSETSSAFSDDSDSRSPNSIVNGTWSAVNPVSPNVQTPPPTPAKMVYPMGRSRAQPSKVPALKMKDIARPKSTKSSSSSNGDGGREGKSKFMGLLKRKKNSKAGSSVDSPSIAGSSGSDATSIDGVSPPTSATTQAFEGNRETDMVHQASRDLAQRIKSRIGSYPLDPYDSVLLDNDRHTGELLMRLNPTNSPSFYDYGNNPPSTVLDLGCGQGHWVVEAAIAWKGYGTRVTGYDMVDISKGLIPWAIEQDVMDSIRFVRGNFLKQRLPFTDNSFDLVRMSCLSLCVTSDSWIFLLQEVCRVLMIGGRLELIDDLIFFPYGKASPVLDISGNSPRLSIPPQLDISIPSSSFTTFSIYDSETTNPGLGHHIEEDEVGDFFDLYDVNEDELDDTATLNGRESQSQTHYRSAAPTSRPRMRASSPAMSVVSWNRTQATCGDLEALFDHMLAHKFGIRKDVHDFVLDLMKEVFGHAREVKTIHLALAPPEINIPGVAQRDNGGSGRQQSYLTTPRESMGLSKSPGLLLWPSTFIPMEQSEIEIHSSKHLRLLLSCKNFLLEHAIEATDDTEIDEESLLEALWEYEGFLRHRFHPTSQQASSVSSNDLDDLNFDAASIRGSIAESISSDSREAMWEIQSEFIERFAWRRPPSSASSNSRSPTPTGDAPQINNPIPSLVSQQSTTPTPPISPMSAVRDTHLSNTTPVYSRDELTHVRTFRVYEAIKIDEALFGSAM